MLKRSRWLLIGVFIIFTIGIVWVVIFYMKQKPIPVVEENKSAEEFKEIDITDWKTYRNEEYGFEIKYPIGWYVYSVSYLGENKIVFSNISRQKIETIQETNELETTVYIMEIRIVNKSINDWLNEQKKLQEQWSNLLETDFFIEKITIGQNEGYKIGVITKKGDRAFSYVLYRGETTYVIATIFPERCRFEECKIFNQMLSSFRFI